MSDVEDSAAAAAPETLHEEDRDDQQEKELGDYDVEDAGDSDAVSDALSDVDEDQFEDYNPENARIEDKPVEIDEDVARTLKAGKRKGQAVRKPKEGRREKKRSRQDDNDGADGEIQTGKRRRAGPSAAASRSERASPEPVPEENLTPEERRKRAIERAAAKDVKKPSQRRRKKDEIDLENDLAERIDVLSQAMGKACEADNNARLAGQPANNKLRILPEVMSLLNSNNQQDAIVDPDHNFLRAVTWFLEPLQDGSLPAYTIQRDIFNALLRLPIEKDSLKASGLGKVVLFYTKSKKPEIGIKRIAERLLGDWSRPILNRTDDYKKRHIETRDFDYQYVFLSPHCCRHDYKTKQSTNSFSHHTGPPNSDKHPARSSHCRSGPARRRRSSRAARSSASASWPSPTRAATARASRACPRATAWRPRAPSPRRRSRAPSTSPSAPAATPPSARSCSGTRPRRSRRLRPAATSSAARNGQQLQRCLSRASRETGLGSVWPWKEGRGKAMPVLLQCFALGGTK